MKQLFRLFFFLPMMLCTCCAGGEDESMKGDPLPNIYENQIEGFGWRNYRQYEIDPATGIPSTTDFYMRGEDSDFGDGGGSASNMSFEKDTMFTYYIDDTLPADGFRKKKIVFDDSQNAVFEVNSVTGVAAKTPVFTILSIEGDTLTVIGEPFYRGGSLIMCKVIYVRMSAEELEKTKKFYSVDIDKLLNE